MYRQQEKIVSIPPHAIAPDMRVVKLTLKLITGVNQLVIDAWLASIVQKVNADVCFAITKTTGDKSSLNRFVSMND